MLAQWRVRTELALPELEAYPLGLVTVLRWCETPWPAAAGGDLASQCNQPAGVHGAVRACALASGPGG